MEIWKSIEGYEGSYEISNLGRVKSMKFGKERMLKACKNSSGYFVVTLYKEGKQKTKTVHELVSIAFLNNTPDGYKIVVDHIDNNPLNNKLVNLQIISQRKNTSKDKKGSSKYTGVSLYKSTNKWFAKIYLNGKQKYLGLFVNELEASQAYQNELKNIQNGKTI